MGITLLIRRAYEAGTGHHHSAYVGVSPSLDQVSYSGSIVVDRLWSGDIGGRTGRDRGCRGSCRRTEVRAEQQPGQGQGVCLTFLRFPPD